MSNWATILLSQQHLYPSGADTWVSNSLRALQFIRQQGWGLLSSVGMPTWDLLTCAAADMRVPLTVILAQPHPLSIEQIAAVKRQYELPDDTPVAGADGVTDSMSRAESAGLRDKAIIDQAAHLLPVSIRPGGKLESLLTTARGTSAHIISNFSAPYEHKTDPPGYTIEPAELSDEITAFPLRLVTHWTRATHEPWPTESIREYYRAIVSSQYPPRMAIDSLKNILHTRRLVASRRHMPKGISAVSLTGLLPAAMVPLMRWRSRYRQMSFEPYGIGIRKEAAFRIGIEPVLYVSDADSVMDTDKRWKCQTKGKHTDWRLEREYRHRGDIELAQLWPDDLVLFCKTKEESQQLSSEFGLQSYAVTKH